MKAMKKRIASLLAAIFCLTLLTVPAGAYVRVDTDAPVSLTLNYASEGEAIEGLRVRLYKVYDMTDAVRFNPTEAFQTAYGSNPVVDEEGNPVTDEEGNPVYTTARFQFDVHAAEWQTTDTSGKVRIDWTKMTTTLASLIAGDLADEATAANAPKPVAEGTSGADGKVIFNQDSQGNILTAGLYLVIGEPKVDGRYTYTPQTFMTALPLLNTADDTWNYDPQASEKLSTHYDPPSTGGGGINITVRKVWDDADAEDVVRPESVTVQLLRNGTAYGNVITLDEDNDWYHRWTDLNSGSQWQVSEVDVPEGYTVSVERNNNSFVITNTADTEITDPDIPEGPAPSTEPDQPSTEPDQPGTDIPDIDIPGGDIPGGDIPAEPDEPGTDIPDDGTPGGDLPQTGMLWWPVQVLTLAGILFFSIGWVEYRRSKKR